MNIDLHQAHADAESQKLEVKASSCHQQANCIRVA